jgi:alkanesulfonate monooxygenase SsuD/methylene tetrahydromethanopterin reductase-like flavin-dependent oxidoreductase (luciferase family)
MAAQTERIRCGMLVTSVTYRHPAVLANIVATLDHIAGGRLEYGIGAGWNALEHDQYGIPFPRIGERMDMLDETCRILRSMWTQETTTFEGEHWQLKDAWCNPQPVQAHLPLVIGGAGEKRTLRIVAEHADIWNTFLGTTDELEHKLDVLAGHCADVGRDPADIRVSLTCRAVVRERHEEAAAIAEPLIARLRDTNPRLANSFVYGTAEAVVERLAPFRALGTGDFLVGAMAPWDWESIERVAGDVAPAVRA